MSKPTSTDALRALAECTERLRKAKNARINDLLNQMTKKGGSDAK
jgi:hypothetical protein